MKDSTKGQAPDIVALERNHVLQTYRRPEFVLVRGEGAYVYDRNGRAYIDGVAGIAVNSLGHGDPQTVATIRAAAEGLIHVSNLYHTEPQVLLARALVERSFADRAFFCNSGTEAMEGAIKFARKFGRQNYGDDKTHIVAFTGSFHGRTLGALSITATEKYRAPFEPLIPGVRFAPFNDASAAEEAITEEVCAVVVEPVQGESGIHPATRDFLECTRAACNRAGALLVFDEVQCGLARTGTLWAYQHHDVVPDLMTLAKPLAAGLPMGAVLMTQAVADVMVPGDHGSTFAAGPLVCQVAQVVLDRVSAPDFLAEVQEKGHYLSSRLSALAEKSPLVHALRGMGLMWGMECSVEAASVIAAGYRHGILVCSAGPNVVRLLPPLTISQSEIDELVQRLTAAFYDVEHEPA